jgi:hypothetical protein
MAEGRRGARPSARPGWVRRHLPGWHVSWSRTVLSPSVGGYQDGSGSRGSSVVIIISARR